MWKHIKRYKNNKNQRISKKKPLYLILFILGWDMHERISLYTCECVNRSEGVFAALAMSRGKTVGRSLSRKQKWQTEVMTPCLRKWTVTCHLEGSGNSNSKSKPGDKHRGKKDLDCILYTHVISCNVIRLCKGTVIVWIPHAKE